MKCHICGNEMTKVVADLPFKISNSTIVIIKGLPVYQCGKCPEYLLKDEVMESVDKILAKVNGSAELEIVKFAA